MANYPLLGLRLPFRAYTPDMDENRRSVTKIAALNAEIACFGHGSVMRHNTDRLIRSFAAAHGLPLYE
jgi:hypothetical protein